MRRVLVAAAMGLDAMLRWVDRLFVLVAGVSLATSLAMNVVNLVLRNLAALALPWVFSWTMVLFVWMVFLAFFPIYRRRIDITVDVIVRRLPPRARTVCRLATDLLGIVVLAVILVEGPLLIATQVGVIEFVGLQRYTLTLPLLASCLFIALDLVADALHTLAGQEPPHVLALDLMPLAG